MFGALRLVSVEQGYDPRDFALVAFGGAGPLARERAGSLLGCWPVIIPPSPGVLCAYGDATTRDATKPLAPSFGHFSATYAGDVAECSATLVNCAGATLDAEGVPRADQSTVYQVDVRYHGQGLELPIAVDLDSLRQEAGIDTYAPAVRRDPQAAVYL